VSAKPFTLLELLELRRAVEVGISPHYALGCSDVQLGEKFLLTLDATMKAHSLLEEFTQTCAELVYSLSDESSPADAVVETAKALCEHLGIPYKHQYLKPFHEDDRLRAGARRILMNGWNLPLDHPRTIERLKGTEPTGAGLSAIP
jgi:hypothetical protein